tara:strand:+ start:4395 stop:4625 length:231 start_codon:yes stop_codon:yes gene_type:complete
MKKAKKLLSSLPDNWHARALLNFDEEFFNIHQEKEEPIETAGDALRCAFAWEDSVEGYEEWAGVHASYGNIEFTKN